MAKTKYYTEYETTGNTQLWIEDTIYVNKATSSVAVGKINAGAYKLLVTGDTYSEQYYMRTPDTGTSGNFLIYQDNKIQMRTGASGSSGSSGTSGSGTGGSGTPGGTSFNVQYNSGGTFTGTSALDFECQKRLKVTDVFQVAALSDFPAATSCYSSTEGDIIRLSGNARYSDGYYVYDGNNWIAMVTW